MKKIFLIIIIPTLIFFSGCDSSLKPARGLEDQVIVVADSSEFESIKESLEKALEKTILTPQPEKLFEIKRIDFNELNKYRNYKNLFFAAPINSGTHVSSCIKSSLDSASIELLKKGESLSLIKNDLWAKNQIVILATANSLEELEFEILKRSDSYLYNLQKISDRRLKQSLYSGTYENEKVEAQLLKDYGWLIYVQVDFVLAVNNPEENFVWLRRSPDSDMERWIFVHWIDNATPEYLNKDSIIKLRNTITEKFYRTSDDREYVEIADTNVNPVEVNFNGRYALYTQGLWRMTDKFMGGPFVNYTFYDETTKRIYMIDGSIFAPKYFKKKLIQQVDVLLQSFLTDKEVDADKKKSLLKKLD